MEVNSKMDEFIQNIDMCMSDPNGGIVKDSILPQGMWYLSPCLIPNCHANLIVWLN